MEDHVWLFGFDQAVHCGATRHVGQVRTELAPTQAVTPAGLELPLDQVERALRSVHQDEAARPDREDLTRELGSDGPARSRDHDRLVLQDLADRSRMLIAGRAPEQVRDLDAPDAIGVERAVEQVVHGRDRPDVEADRHGGIDDPPDGTAWCARHGDQQRLSPRRLDRLYQGIEAAVDTQVGDEAAGQAHVVIEEADRNDPGLGPTLRGLDHQHAGPSGSIKQGSLSFDHRRRPGHPVGRLPESRSASRRRPQR